MDAKRNPYAPGAGTPPPILAGRDDLVAKADLVLARARDGRAAKSFIAVGLRGVGKTVVLNKVRDLAEGQGYQSVFIEAYDEIRLADAISRALRGVLLKLNRMEGAKELTRQGLRVLRGFASAFKVNFQGVEFGIEPEPGTADSGDLAVDLPELMLAVGEAARQNGTAVALMIDEVQYLSDPDMAALIMAIHRVNQRQVPVVLFGAGLPQLRGKMGEAKSYVERAFDFPRVDALHPDDARTAIVEPARREGVSFDGAALDEILRVTSCYPYFLQEWGHAVWLRASGSPIDLGTVVAAYPDAIGNLDASFLRVRLDRMTPTEKRYMRALAALGPGSHRSGEIAKVYGARVTSIAPIRGNLIAKGMIYSPSHGDTAFTVPLFDEFMRRELPDWNDPQDDED